MEQEGAFAIIEGSNAARRIATACQTVRSLVPHLRADVVQPKQFASPSREPEDGAWIPCEAFVADAEWVKETAVATGRRLGTEDPVVATSLFVQNYSYRILTMAIACGMSSGVVPDSSATATTITLEAGRPFVVGYIEPIALATIDGATAPQAAMDDVEGVESFLNFVIATCLHEHLDTLVDSSRRRTRIGARLLWGNVASSAAMAFLTMEGCLGPWVKAIGEQFFRVCPSELQGLGSFISLERDGTHGWFWERTNCCLYDRLPGNLRCADCSRTPAKQRRRAYLSTLE